MDFLHQFEFIFEQYSKIAKIEGWRVSKLGLAKFLGISQGRMQKWETGQIPRPADLKLLHDKMGLSYEWLVTGEGDPFISSRDMDAADTIEELEKENARLKEELAESDRLNRKLTTRLLLEGGSDVKSSPDTAKAAGQR